MRSLITTHWALALALLLTLAAGLATIRQPEFGDGQAYMVPNALIMSKTFVPFIEDEVHPPLYFLLEGLAFRLFGPHVWVLHAMGVACSLLAVLATWAMGMTLAGPHVAGAAALLLACWPPFLVQTTLVRLDIPVAAFSSVALLAALRGWRLRYLLAGCAAPLVKAPGVLIPAVLGALSLTRTWRPRFSPLLLWVPLVSFGLWLVACKLRFGWFLYPENVQDFSLFSQPRLAWDGLVFWVRRIVLDQGAWLPLGCSLVFPHGVRWAVLHGLAALVGWVIPGVGVLDTVALVLTLALAASAWRWGGFWRAFPLVAASLVALFFTYQYRFPRYMLPAWPGVALVAGAGLARWRRYWVPLLLSGALMVAHSLSPKMWSWADWSLHESTFGYVTMVRALRQATAFLEGTKGVRILAGGKASQYLSVPALGYVSAPIPHVGVDEGCESVRDARFYFEVTTRSKEWERRVRSVLEECAVRMAPVLVRSWEGPDGTTTVSVFRLDPVLP